MKNKRINLVVIFLMVITLIMATAISASAATVKINKKTVTIDAGSSVTLKITGTSKSVKWSSSSKYVAAVKSTGKYKAKVTAKKAGTAKVTAKVGKKKYICTVTVKKAVSQEFKNALSKAQTYSDLMHMSKARLYDQLTSEYGEKFPEDAAKYAIDNVKADWNKNALKTAEAYYKNMAMSKDAIYMQLTSEYGEKFTEEQAQYAVDHLE